MSKLLLYDSDTKVGWVNLVIFKLNWPTYILLRFPFVIKMKIRKLNPLNRVSGKGMHYLSLSTNGKYSERWERASHCKLCMRAFRWRSQRGSSTVAGLCTELVILNSSPRCPPRSCAGCRAASQTHSSARPRRTSSSECRRGRSPRRRSFRGPSLSPPQWSLAASLASKPWWSPWLPVINPIIKVF